MGAAVVWDAARGSRGKEPSMQSNRPAHDSSGKGCGHDRRSFLKRFGLGTAAASGMALGAREAFGQPVHTTPPADAGPLPSVTLCGHTIPRMIIGANPIGGWSHSVPNMSKAMTQYFTPEMTYQFIRHCEDFGLTAWLTYWGKKPLGALRKRWEEGSKMKVYFLAVLGRDGNIRGAESNEEGSIKEYKPMFLLHHGNVTDALFRAKKQEKVHDFVKKVHDQLGIPAGVSAHNPEVFKYIEDKGWECDLYQCCLYYVTRPKQEIRAKLGTAPLGEPFLENDRNDMLKVIREVKKPCIAFKILAAGWHCFSPMSVAEAFQTAFAKVKKTDVVIVGMWTKFKDEVAENVKLLRKYGQG
jgi:hypothetical protein